ncbi:MAG: hypothetical protein KA099_06050 [Alphaproteobacteria bacterium]|nr:hypothetical protein [Alphaproteobacteria bacterium]MBK9586363.1 hypothetical protein [Alphaproteobacteria bacterium]MBP7758018.1 hypothetical protein [Alphaproteobacteria bacterium]MBP7761345.1 hypothetical protein [Alphaproteobacteria bacterium]MBP7904871.1 hypothetical protein [Alphaproteobacteria bacterium]
MEIDFNKQLERPRFIYKPNPMMKRAYQIFELMPKNNAYVPVGEYILLNHEEDPELTELKMGNLVLLLNGKKDVKDLSKMSSTRVLFTVMPEDQSADQTKIIFKDYKGKGVSVDNAVFTIRRGVLHDKRKFI